MAKTIVQFEGFQELADVLTELDNDLGEKDAKRILRVGIKKAMEPVLVDAKMEALKDTGALAASLQIEARKPTGKDRKSKYVSYTDQFIGAVTTASGAKLQKTAFVNLRSKEVYKGKKEAIKQVGIKSDARAIAVEFGTANMAGKPFLRPALENNRSVVISELAEHLRTALSRYRARQAKKALKGK
jgi:HK97 gp10 family phage protein